LISRRPFGLSEALRDDVFLVLDII
jgi:hypothetical protein